jgi:hypothetical protein
MGFAFEGIVEKGDGFGDGWICGLVGLGETVIVMLGRVEQ